MKAHQPSSYPHNHHNTFKQIICHWIRYGSDIRSNHQQQPQSLSSSQSMINDCQQQASLHIIVIIWEKRQQLFCCINRCVKYWCIVMESCTHSCACHCNAHYVIAVNKKTVPFLCNSGRSLIAFWRIWYVLFNLFCGFFFSFCLCLSLSVCVS